MPRGRVVSSRFAATALFAVGGLQAAGQGSAPVESIDVYGSRSYDSARLRAEFEPDLLRYAALGWEAQTNPRADMEQLEAQAVAIEAKIRDALGTLAHFEMSMTTDFAPPQRVHVSVDVVEQQDAARRMPFRGAPTGRLEDPDGLITGWNEYQEKVIELARAGTLLPIQASDCPVLHCIAPFDQAELAPYLARFNDGARRQEDALYRIAAESADAGQRANALFLLAHTNDAEQLLPVLARAIYDPSGGVRNNAMRVLMYMAEAHPDLDFPIRDLVAAFDFPSSSDRNKAGYTLAALATQPRYRDAIREAVPAALRVLRLAKPNNHDPAYQILTRISGESFGDRDYAAWERWAADEKLADP
jgi:hypothetical protein